MEQGNLKYYYSRLNIAEKLIAINVLVFIVNGLFEGLGNITVMLWFELPTDFYEFLSQPWSIVSYSFFHTELGHIFWNMIMLYFTGRIFLNLFPEKRFINVYFLGVIFGGLLFIFSYNIFPALSEVKTTLVGASAGVTAVLIYICTYIPNKEVRVFFFNVKLWHVGTLFVFIDLIQIPAGNNIGGHFSHLGGALLGYVYASQTHKGRDIGEGFSNFLGYIANIFKGKEKKAPLKTVYRRTETKHKATVNYDKENHQRKIDAILDKISKAGYESLSKDEKDFLFKVGK